MSGFGETGQPVLVVLLYFLVYSIPSHDLNDSLKKPNARHQARGTAEARHERRLFPVACMPLLGSSPSLFTKDFRAAQSRAVSQSVWGFLTYDQPSAVVRSGE